MDNITRRSMFTALAAIPTVALANTHKKTKNTVRRTEHGFEYLLTYYNHNYRFEWTKELAEDFFPIHGIVLSDFFEHVLQPAIPYDVSAINSDVIGDGNIRVWKMTVPGEELNVDSRFVLIINICIDGAFADTPIWAADMEVAKKLCNG